MNRLRTASYVCLAIGIIIALVGGAMASAIYGCVPAANMTCNPSPPPEDVLGGYLFYLGAGVIIVSLAVLVLSFGRHPRVVV